MLLELHVVAILTSYVHREVELVLTALIGSMVSVHWFYYGASFTGLAMAVSFQAWDDKGFQWGSA